MTDEIVRVAGDLIGRLFDSVFETKGDFRGHQIAVRVTVEELKLYVDGTCVECAKALLAPSPDVALVRGAVKDGESIHVIEVYGRSVWFGRPKIKLCVGGVKIAGDDF